MLIEFQVDHVGGPEVLKLQDIPVPEPQDHEILIKVEWTGTNYFDTYKRSGLYPAKLPMTLGTDAVGIVVTLPRVQMVATSLPPLKIGQRVLTCEGAAFAEYMVAPWWQVAPLPDDIDPKSAVAMATSLFTAMYLVRESYQVKKGDWVLVRAAAGGVGLFLCQLCRYYGAHVIGTTSSESKVALARAHGAEHVFLTSNTSAENIEAVHRLTGNGVHVVYDGIGEATWEEDFQIVRPKGTIVSFGNASGPVLPFAPLKLSPKALKVTRPTLGPFIAEPEDFARYATEIFDLVKKGAIKTSIHKVYPFTVEGVAQSQLDITSRNTTGKLVIHVAN
ncbi:hypothetical protein EHS25_000837 [Saitozyma podzolica]|uniref:Probable quinone oxidoreductase n=1 Tax=Saitozyma podzolica TaxID=1890683 RepID=A0A427YXD7_9TREE|nr:hypothetical protein EHS25_000837 [Saitozyma podzolica]